MNSRVDERGNLVEGERIVDDGCYHAYVNAQSELGVSDNETRLTLKMITGIGVVLAFELSIIIALLVWRL